MNFVSKTWGWELWICNNQKYCGKKLFIKQGHHLSFHSHRVKDEVLFVQSGKMNFIHNTEGEVKSIEMSSGYAYPDPERWHTRPDVKPKIVHQNNFSLS